MQKINFLTLEQINLISSKYILPIYVYSEEKLINEAQKLLNFPSAYWHTVRYAMKANSNLNILRIFKKKWIKVDCSSEYEVYRAINAWFKAEDIQLSGQETPRNLIDLINKGVFLVATSLKQLEEIWKIKSWYDIWVRINPWMWSWAFKAISTWWKTSPFGIWYEKILEIKKISEKYNLKIKKIHLHIWSENTPESWMKSADIWFDFISEFKDVTIFDMWWGLKKAIMPYEKSAELISIWEKVSESFRMFYKKTWRKIHLEMEPWKYLVINSCSVIAKVDDIVDTWENWYKFIRTNSWMTEMPRVSMYWVQQPIILLNNSIEEENYVVVWHCCESWDILTPKLYDQETIEAIKLPKASIWDIIVFDWIWAYSSSMSMKNYNSFPEAWELMIRENWEIVEIRKRQELLDIWKNEVEVI